jgi:hypothetical protein
MREYNAKSLVHNRWAPLKRPENGHWQRTWHFAFSDNIPPHLSLEAVSNELSENDFQVTLTQNGAKQMNATVTTIDDGWDDRFFFATYRLFERINEKIGTLQTIEGQDRGLWRPWRRG